MRNIGESKIYIVPELSADNEQWINPGFGLSTKPVSLVLVQEDLKRSDAPTLLAFLTKLAHICQCGVRSAIPPL